MPPRRRPTRLSAAALPASRLPLGTPTWSSSAKSPRSSDEKTHSTPSVKSRSSNSSSGNESFVTVADSITPSSQVMAPKSEFDPSLTKSIAEAKLERQRKRIEEADAPLSLDKRKQSARSKAKQWKPFDFTADSPMTVGSPDEGATINEIRINTFRAVSRQGSSVRSASLLSQRTSETGPSDMDRQDSHLTDSGFQIFRGRRSRKNFGESNSHEDRSEQRQATVEASFDKREIYNVFGNALPGPEFITENLGHRNGVVQFIQHPNGDISAQQWSAARYIWENIGHFSNIRKKIEGQLASDRLKGETAHQTLQQNTLTYFRTIAKQREATVMGLPFGPKEIQAAMPHPPRVETNAASTMSTGSTREAARTGDLQILTKADTRDAPAAAGDQNAAAHVKPLSEPYFQQLSTQAQSPLYPFHNRQQHTKQADPFYSTSTLHQIYGGYGYMPQSYNQNTHNQTPNRPLWDQRAQELNYDFHFPLPGATPGKVQSTSARAHNGDRFVFGTEEDSSYRPTHVNAPPGLSNQSYTSASYFDFTGHEKYPNTSGISGTPAKEILAPQPKVAVPFNNRTSMSDQLWKISETAKERNLSQPSISRTVLYDPYQSQHSNLDSFREPVKPAISELDATFSKNVAGKKLQPPTPFDPNSANFFPSVLASQVATKVGQTPLSPIEPVVKQKTHKSFIDWSKFGLEDGGQAGTLLKTSNLATQKLPVPPVPRTEYRSLPETKKLSPEEIRQLYDKELKDWWTGGNKFSRQEEFFSSLVAVDKSSRAKSVNSPPAHLTPIGPPSRTPKTNGPAPFNHTTTRLLIPVLENLTSYVQGPSAKRRDYFCQWSPAPEWAIDRSESGNNSFFDEKWGQPPARVGRDPRYQNRSWMADQTPQRSRFGSSGSQGYAYGSSIAIGSGIDRRFNFAARY